MDTPERCKAGGTPISKFEDSPVFNFINSLSPIKPVKSVQSIQAFHSPCFAAISPVFASPHVSSCKESRFLVRRAFPVSVNQDTISDDINESILPAEVQSGPPPATIALAQENSNISCSLNEATVDPADESSTRPNLSPPKQFGNCTPNHSTSACYGDSLDFKLDNSCSSLELVRFVGDGLDNADNSLSTDGNVTFIENQTKGGISGSDWENFVSVDADDMLLVDSAIGSGASKIQEDDGISVGDETQMGCTRKVPSSAFQDEVILKEQDQITENEVNGLSPGCKAEFQQNRGVRRRCLIFEVAAISKINQKISSEFPSPYLPAKSTSDDQQKVSLKTSKVQVPCILPGIGLHLNALATSSLDKVISEKTKVSGIEISSRPSSISKFYSENPGEKHSEIPLALQQHQVLNESKIQNCHFDASQTHGPLNAESNSPKKKKRKTEIGGENEGCKRCHCKKSKCLKLYCECFAAGVYCVEPCSCQGCLNKPSHEDTVLATRKQIESRNPLAFAPKVIVSFEHDVEMGEESNKTPASARHKRGCNCKKSNCLKKYCECFQGGVGCSFSCRCEGCKNAFGMKFGSEENEEDKELDVCNVESIKLDDVTKSNNVQKKEISHISSDNVAITPFHACSAKPPRTSALLQSCRARNPRATCKKDTNNMEPCQEDATPVITSHSSPCTEVKTASPKGKRVSLPLNVIGMSPDPNRKASRRLILKSISSFPPLCSDTTS